MSKKTYTSRVRKQATFVGEVKGKRMEINFERGFGNGFYCSYTTADKDEQEFLESTDDFKGNLLYVSNVAYDKKPADKVAPKETVKSDPAKTLTYKSRQDLYDQTKTLFPEAGVTKSMSELSLLSLAKDNGITFVKE